MDGIELLDEIKKEEAFENIVTLMRLLEINQTKPMSQLSIMVSILLS